MQDLLARECIDNEILVSKDIETRTCRRGPKQEKENQKPLRRRETLGKVPLTNSSTIVPINRHESLEEEPDDDGVSHIGVDKSD